MSDSRYNLIIILLLSLLILLGLYEIIKLEKLNEDLIEKINDLLPKESGACNNDSRYSTKEFLNAEEVGVDDANTWIGDYRKAHEDDVSIYKTTGFHISKKALDSIFSRNLRANSVTFNLINQGDSALGLVVAGVRSDSSDIQFNATLNSSIFRVNSMCPLDCCFY